MTAPERVRAGIGKFTQRMRRDDRKRQLLQEAKQLFVEHGYQHTTTEKIAHAAGVTEPVLYRHFENKKALFLEVLQDIRQATHERWLAETDAIASPAAKIEAIIQMYLGSTRDHAVELRIMHRTLLEVHDPEIAECLRSFYSDGERLLAKIIGEGQAVGAFRQDLDPRIGAWELIRSGLAYTLTLPLDLPLFREETYIPRATECVMSCLLVR